MVTPVRGDGPRRIWLVYVLLEFDVMRFYDSFANFAGTIKGDKGNDGSPDTPSEVLTKLVSVDGTGSGLDADLLDGQHASVFATSGAVDTLLSEKQPADADLTAIAALSGTGGYAKRTAADTWTITTPSAADVGAYTSGTVDTLLSGKQPADADLTAIAALSGTGGYAKRTAADTWTIATPSAADVGAYTSGTVDTLLAGKAATGDLSTLAKLDGRAGGQVLKGGTAASETLTLSSTSHATKGKLLFGSSVYDESNNRLGIADSSPAYSLSVIGDSCFDNVGAPAWDYAIQINSSDYCISITGTDSNTRILDFCVGDDEFYRISLSGNCTIGFGDGAVTQDVYIGRYDPNSFWVGVDKNLSGHAHFGLAGFFSTESHSLNLSNGLNSNINLLGSFGRIYGPTASFSIGGFSPISDGFHLILYNSTSKAMTIVNEDVSSTNSYRIKTLTGGNIVLPARTSSCRFIYSSAEWRWIYLGSS